MSLLAPKAACFGPALKLVEPLVRKAIEEIRQQVRDQKYTISAHANKEISDDELTALDIEHAILTGKIEKKYTRDPRGT